MCAAVRLAYDCNVFVCMPCLCAHAAPVVCGVCSENEAKYRCPRCHVRYCAAACYKSHNATKSCIVVPGSEPAARKRPRAAAPDSVAHAGAAQEDDDDLKARLAPAVLNRLVSSDSIRSALRDPALQAVRARARRVDRRRRRRRVLLMACPSVGCRGDDAGAYCRYYDAWTLRTTASLRWRRRSERTPGWRAFSTPCCCA
jgi:hypothetical protein